ncbi:MAG: SIMPL domain-containing protein [Bacteroidaceae bacterium]|nr:SIMPL domain-containing protein [Candidatus Equimonas faecalis]MCQ2205269.1 SIMPL domain-containing protein [Bacteroidaceae bacterium]
MKKDNLIPAVILALGLVIGGFALRSGIVTFKDRDRQVSVKGLAEKEVKADKVTWPLVYKEIGNDPTEMYSRLTQKNATVVQFLKQGGIAEAEISVNPPMIEDRQADNYGNDLLNYRYKATSVITVTSGEVDKVRRLMARQAELMNRGVPLITEQYGDHAVRYDFTSLNDVKPAMVEEATKNARATAEKFASDSGSKVGKINHASQGQFTIEDRDATTPYIKNVRVVITMDYQLE